MDEKPKRRWFRFRLSTVLILIAILAWALACRVHIDHGGDTYSNIGFPQGIGFSVTTNHLPWVIDHIGLEDVDNVCLSASWRNQADMHEHWLTFTPKSVLWSPVALIAFLAWKAAWAVVERRRARRITAPPLS